MVLAKAFVCVKCGKNHKPKESLIKCKKCSGPLDIIYDYKKIEEVILKESFVREMPWHWKYWMFYPLIDLSKKVTLIEGGTPLIKSKYFSNKDREVWLKYEGLNPTGSFKDRGTTVEISKAVELGMKQVCCASTGNMGASVAAYCAKAGIKCAIFLPKDFAGPKIKQIRAYGADIIRVKGRYSQAAKECERYSEKTGIYLMGDYPYREEGEKSVGFEVADQMNWRVPDYIVCPMGNGTLIYAIWDAFIDLKKVGMIDKLPKMIGIQASGCSPIYNAFKKRKKMIEPVKKPRTIATAMECEDPLDGLKALNALRKSKGMAEKVTDQEMRKIIKLLASREGLYVEPAGAASTAGLLKLKKLKGKIVCILTGHGLKDPL
ncbi:MAG: threonine synthase [Candidatus Aenigmarchaeota archaeon]|nr:threonine synthase [Candidatus Aenigmarchaeota archaeon]